MPASLYRLVGKPHHAENNTKASNSQIVESIAPEKIHVENSNVVLMTTNDVVVSETPVHENVVLAEENVQPGVVVPLPAPPVWELTWTKTQLFAVAAKLNLPVTMENTKAEIIAALTVATSS